MIIWGWRGVKKVLERGEFFCPSCAQKTPFAHEKLRRWFTLYFIPVIPLQQLGEQVTCKKCNKSWQPSVLQNDPDRQMTDIVADWTQTMARLAMMSGQPARNAADTIATDLRVISKRDVTPEAVSKVIATVTSAPSQSDVVAALGKLPASLAAPGKEMFLNAAIKVLRLASNCGPNEVDLLRLLGDKVGLTPAHTTGILHAAGLNQV